MRNILARALPLPAHNPSDSEYSRRDSGIGFSTRCTTSCYNLRRMLEVAMNIGSHLLFRIPGARTTSYKEIAKLLGKHRIVPLAFADDQLGKMAAYRNRMA